MSSLIYYIICSALTVCILIGIGMMSKVESAVKGNLLSAICTAAAILLTLYRYKLLSDYALWICIVIGIVFGIIGAKIVKMIEMPEMVAMLNGFGGAASAIVAAISLTDISKSDSFSTFTAALALAIGLVTLIGSLVAAAKLHKIMPQKPIVWKRHQEIITVSIIFVVVLTLAITIIPLERTVLIMLIAAQTVIAGVFGFSFAIRVGGADMPITISLLNSLSGVAGSIAGMAISEPLLVAVGGIVGASGLLLTQIMCRSMNRSLSVILLGKTSTVMGDAQIEVVPHKKAEDMGQELQTHMENENPAKILSESKNVIIVPGYGMALAQAQLIVKELVDILEYNGAQVIFAIHPVAGRMPGHMNVLLCEVDISYDNLYEMDDINPQFADCDVVLVIGANDVINPAANTAKGTPIYGMPVLNVSEAKHVIICNYDLKPGYSGVENPLYSRKEGMTLLLGDAKTTLASLLSDIKNNV